MATFAYPARVDSDASCKAKDTHLSYRLSRNLFLAFSYCSAVGARAPGCPPRGRERPAGLALGAKPRAGRIRRRRGRERSPGPHLVEQLQRGAAGDVVRTWSMSPARDAARDRRRPGRPAAAARRRRGTWSTSTSRPGATGGPAPWEPDAVRPDPPAPRPRDRQAFTWSAAAARRPPTGSARRGFGDYGEIDSKPLIFIKNNPPHYPRKSRGEAGDSGDEKIGRGKSRGNGGLAWG